MKKNKQQINTCYLVYFFSSNNNSNNNNIKLI